MSDAPRKALLLLEDHVSAFNNDLVSDGWLFPCFFIPPFEKAIMHFLTQEDNRPEKGIWGEKLL